MILLTPLALLGLALLIPLTVLHLRRRRRLEEVPSVLLWQDLLAEMRLKRTQLPLDALPLLLQALAVTLLVVSLARPAGTVARASAHVYVLDDSLRMGATDLRPTRLAVAKDMVSRQVSSDAPGTRVSIVVAAAQPYVLVSNVSSVTARRALASVTATAGPSNLEAALQLAAGLLNGTNRHDAALTLLRAREDRAPPVVGPAGIFSSVALARSTDDQSVLRFSVRCSATSRRACRAFALIRNDDTRPVNDPLVLLGDGDLLAEQLLTLPPRSDTGVSFPVPPGRHILQLHLVRADILPADNTAWYVAAPTRPVVATLVGPAGRVTPVERALASLPDVSVRVRSPAQYAPSDAAQADLLILDGWLPYGPLPPAPGLLLIDPPAAGGGRTPLVDTTVSGVNAEDGLLSGLDLTSLDVPTGAAEQMSLPPWVGPVVWTPSGPLLAAGTDGAQRLAALAFDPAATNVTQLDAFPLLLWNLARWAADRLPSAVAVGSAVVVSPPPAAQSVTVSGPGVQDHLLLRQATPAQAAGPLSFTPSQPGVYTVVERGPWGSTSAQIAANVVDDTQTQSVPVEPIPINGATARSAANQSSISWWPWLGIAALLVLAAEWLYAARWEGIGPL